MSSAHDVKGTAEVGHARWVRVHWHDRSETASEAARRLVRWTTAVGNLAGLSNLSAAIEADRVKIGDSPIRLVQPEHLVRILRARDAGRTALHGEERDPLGFGLDLHDPAIKAADRVSVHFQCGGSVDFIGNTITVALPKSSRFQQATGWHLHVLRSLIEAFGPDEAVDQAWLRHLHPLGSALEAAPVVTRNFLRWDSGRRPLQPPIDVPIPPPLSRPWLGGTLYEWPEHAALVGATPD
jgi:hypothetical protein